MTERILRRPDVKAATGLSRSSIYAFMANGKSPKPVKLGVKMVGWTQSEVQDWVAARAQQ